MEFITETQAIKQSLTFICCYLLAKINLKAIFSYKWHAGYFLAYSKLVGSMTLSSSLCKIPADKDRTFA